MPRKIIFSLIYSFLPFFALAQTEEVLPVEDTLSAATPLYSDTPAIVFPGLELGEADFKEYFDTRFDALASASMRPEFSFVPETGTPYTLLYSYGSFGSFEFPGRYGGIGFQLTPGIELNAVGITGSSLLRYGWPLYEGALQMSLVVRPSDSSSITVWGQYVQMNALTPVPAAMPGSLQRMSVGAAAKFKVGNTTFGVSAEFSTH